MKKSEYFLIRTFINTEYSGPITRYAITTLFLTASLLGWCLYLSTIQNVAAVFAPGMHIFIALIDTVLIIGSGSKLISVISKRSGLIQKLNTGFFLNVSYEETCNELFNERFREEQEDLEEEQEEG